MRRTRAILMVRMKRIAALLIALFVAAAPSALEACQISCASMSSMSTMSAHGPRASGAQPMPHGDDDEAQPSCHEAATPAHALAAVSAPCDHHDAQISSSLVTTGPDVVASPVQAAAAGVANAAPALLASCRPIVVAVDRLALRLSTRLQI